MPDRPLAEPAGRAARRVAGAVQPGASHWVSLRYFCITRLAITATLLLASAVLDNHTLLGTYDPVLFLRVVLGYLPLGTAFLLLAMFLPRQFHAQLAAQLALDLCVLTLLMYTSGGPRSGMAVLFLLPVAGAAILGTTTMALLFAALSALSILGESVWRELTVARDSVSFVQAGLYGASSFAIALVMNRLADRLISQERIAQLRGRALLGQIEINRAVVAEMQDGVLILSASGEPRSLNPAAARLLRIDDSAAVITRGWGDHDAGHEISRRFLEWRARRRSPQVVEVSVGAGGSGHVPGETGRPRVRFAPPASGATSGDHVVFLEDLEQFEERAQQLKLASMGRLTASIAHEIRNPLSAITHASALIGEESIGPGVARLVAIVQDNAVRLNRIVENILQLSRRGSAEAEAIDLAEALVRLVAEYCREQNCPGETIAVTIAGTPVARFNQEHLRAVLLNLLQNARRYASGGPGSNRVQAAGAEARDGERVEIVVEDDGPGIDPEAREHLFEPFFTTHVRGTGLGLYLAHELCIANGADLSFVPRGQLSKEGRFVINAVRAV